VPVCQSRLQEVEVVVLEFVIKRGLNPEHRCVQTVGSLLYRPVEKTFIQCFLFVINV
jgi:hypothetical protein